MDMMELSAVTKRYEGLTALDQVDLNVKRGELFGLLGPNGAGKTTLIRICTGQTKPLAGQVHIAGLDIRRNAVQVKQQIGLVPDISNLYDEISALDNLIFAAELYGVPRNERKPRAERLLAQFGLLERRQQKTGTLSRGLKRRLTIAAALIHHPALLILDEPTTGLDVQSATTIRALITELHDDGTTVFMTTHYIEEANQLCQRVAIINEGHIIAVNTPDGLKAQVGDQHRIEVAVTPRQGSAEILQTLPGVTAVTTRGDKFLLQVVDASDVLPRLIDAVRANERKIVSVNTIPLSLEDAFVHLTGVSPEAMIREKDATRRIAV